MSELLNFILDHEEPFKSKARLASLYADFSSQKALNPDGYQANILAWRNALFHASRAGFTTGPDGRTSFLAIRAGDNLEKELQSNIFGRPLALGAVLNEAVSNKDMIPLKEFLEAKESIYYRPWMQLPTPWQGTQWIIRQLGLTGSGNAVANGRFVMISNVEEAARKVLSQISKHSLNPSSLVFSPSTFAHSFSNIFSTEQSLSANDMTILLTHLSRDHHALSFTPNTIKFAPPSSASTDLSLSPPTITQNDITVAQLQSLSLDLNTQISGLESRIQSFEAKSRAAAAKSNIDDTPSNRTTALSALRSKRLAQSVLERRSNSLSLIEDALAKIDEATGQVEMVRAMEGSASVLKALNKEIGGIERVDKVMDDLREEKMRVDEVQTVLNEGVESGDSQMLVDDEKLEKELEELQREVEEEMQEETILKLQELPNPRETEQEYEMTKPTLVKPEGADESLNKTVDDLKNMTIEDKDKKIIATTS